jgi:hypothetical protein
MFFRTWHMEFAWQFRTVGISFRQSFEEGTLSLHLPPISLYLCLPKWRTVYQTGITDVYEDQREIRLMMNIWGKEFGGWCFGWSLWTPHMTWNSKTPWYRHGTWTPIDTLLGRVRHRVIRVVEATESIDVPMPEGMYPTKISILEEGWRRPRSPFEKKIKRCHADMWVPIPHMGKGENSWDCGEDGTYGLCCVAKDIPEAVAKIVESAVRDRKKYDGGHIWPKPPSRQQYETDMAKIRAKNVEPHEVGAQA